MLHVLVGAALAVAAITAVSPAIAARGGAGGKGGGKPPKHTVTCSVTAPAAVQSGSNFVVSGTGFVPYQQVTVYRDGAGYGMFADVNGNFALTLYSGMPGWHTLTASKLVNGSWTPCWSGTYEVLS
jgi:hypothetical protein